MCRLSPGHEAGPAAVAHGRDPGQTSVCVTDLRQLRRDWRVRSLWLPKVQTLEADPPWKFKGASRRGGVAWRGRYTPMDIEAIKRYPLPPLAENCRLFLWRVGAMQQEALDVIKAWGFEHKSEIVWVKTTTHSGMTGGGHLMLDVDGIGNDEVLKDKHGLAEHGIVHHGDLANLAFGAGHQTRYAHETCLIATRGNPSRDEHFRSVFFAPIGEHSQKPAKFYDLVERMSPGPRYRLFSCEPRQGWTSEYHMAHRGDYAQAA